MSVINAIEQSFKKPHVVDVRSGDSVRVHQKIKEGNKERVQVFEGLVINTSRKNSHTATIAVRRISSGVGVEKTFLIHSPLITKIEVVKRSKVRRNYLSYMRKRTGKSARLSGVDFDQQEVNYVPEPEVKEEPKAEAVPDEPKKVEVKDSKEEKEVNSDAKQDEADEKSDEQKPDAIKKEPPRQDESKPSESSDTLKPDAKKKADSKPEPAKDPKDPDSKDQK